MNRPTDAVLPDVEMGLESGEDQPLTGPGAQDVETYDCRKAFAEALSELARQDERVVAVCNDSVGAGNLGGFQKEFPDRLINVGIAEQDLVGVGAGLANGGVVPVVFAAGPFPTGRGLGENNGGVDYSGVPGIPWGPGPGKGYGGTGLEGFAGGPVGPGPGEGLGRARPDPPVDRGCAVGAGHGGSPVGLARRSCADSRRRPMGCGAGSWQLPAHPPLQGAGHDSG